ncbi:hypothetical protein TWF694_002165 [Orbilia ellipsospora]|uniref:Uncharacterized protein n=1 Tax=Orbilia ellipsospora TaxID=2528407 RepID=A0AAV9X7C2_9PEZI
MWAMVYASGSQYTSHPLAKRMQSAGNYYGDFLLVPPDYLNKWIRMFGTSLDYYLLYSDEIRSKLAELDAEVYITQLQAYARQYSKALKGNDNLEILPWQKFIGADLLRDLRRPWDDSWESSPYALEPIQRVEGVSQGVLDKAYPRTEIDNEDVYEERGYLMDAKISTVEYLREFTLPFDNSTELANWIFAPRYIPVGGAITGKEGPYLGLSRRERIETSLKEIYQKLKRVVNSLETPHSRFDGDIKILPSELAQPAERIIDEIEYAAESWERVMDIVGVMISIMTILKKDPT